MKIVCKNNASTPLPRKFCIPNNMKVFGVIWLALASTIGAFSLDINNITSIYHGQALVAQGLMDYYQGDKYGGTPGMFPEPYYWWEAGAAWGAMLDYTYYTGNDTYTDVIKEALLFQAGTNGDFLPANQSSTEGNDDQGFWAIAAMTAAEQNFSNPSSDQYSWVYLAQAVFNQMVGRWGSGGCGGGLRWQLVPFNSGWNYKSSVANGCFFNIAARLARYTDNKTYADWAEKIWDWSYGVQFIQPNPKGGYSIYDGADTSGNCSDIQKLEWTYNYGLYIAGSAYLYNMTNDTSWLNRIDEIWERSLVFFNTTNKIMYEAACQPTNHCNNDERSFKGIFASFLGRTAVLAPTMNSKIYEYMDPTAYAVAASCSGGTDGHTCGLNWFVNGWDGMYGLGEQISGLGVLNSLLVHDKPPPFSQKTGGTSKGNSSAGMSSSADALVTNELTITTKDKVGAGFVTVAVVGLMIGTGIWLVV